MDASTPSSSLPRTFFPYIPNEVKHRKRTSRAQLKVLEEVFRKDTKPNAALRKKLAAELDMGPRAVQVWFQNRRAKDKQLRKRAEGHLDQEKPLSPQATNPSSPNDSPQDESTATEIPTDTAQEPVSSPAPDPPSNESIPTLKIPSSHPPDSSPAWQIPPGTPPDDIPPHHAPVHGHRSQDPGLYNTRRGSLPAIPSFPIQGADSLPPSHQLVDRRNSLDVNCYRLIHHPFARIAREKNEALLAKSPLSPPGSTQAVIRGPGSIRAVSHSVHPYSRPALAHRASEPHAWAPLRGSPFPPVPEGGSSIPLSTSASPPSSSGMPNISSRRPYDNRLYALTSRTLSSPIPGPLPTPDFQFGDPSSASTPPNTSPVPGEVDTPPSSSSSSSAHGPSPDITMGLDRWAFPRGSTTSIASGTSASGGLPGGRPRDGEGDAEDAVSTTASSSSFSGLSRFGSVASITGSESSAMFSEVSSCVAADMGYEAGRRGSSGSGHYLELRMSGLNMSGQHVSGDMSTSAPSGYASSTSTLSPNDSPQTEEPNPGSSLNPFRVGSMYEFGNVPPNEIVATRRGSIPPCVVVPSPVGTPDHSLHSHGHGMYTTNGGVEMKYAVQGWSSGPGGYVPQHPHFSSHHTRSFVPDGATTAPR
ncbi:hypothetical protein J3A83DRAFT_2701344 [Scleroderma citrinum]